MLRSFLTWLLLLGSTLLVGACCANNSCYCQDTFDNVVFFRFNAVAGTPGAFTPQELDTIIITRTPVAPKSTLKPDTIRIVRATLAQIDDSIALGQGLTFSSAPLRFTKYQYRIWPAGLPQQVFKIDSLNVQSRPDAVDGCCTCYKVIAKDLRLNNVPVNLLDPKDSEKPVYTLLRKY
ncbi:hypothetical protein [Hymenobacter chitinivorans]|uniref:Tissue inhibitor of metalloproteinase n=1 Tax=Hymenobacter chitinivorans DSM 11115 TaxID=1121954 RepID=A0A2M9BMN5_9BACT|nr:hypothetical protein [Hymenobacter chitinivorans]PJJ59195.1 hypothetical protein CLV45_0611 [Hymenobacter chitinivorans DSM 11115]